MEWKELATTLSGFGALFVTVFGIPFLKLIIFKYKNTKSTENDKVLAKLATWGVKLAEQTLEGSEKTNANKRQKAMDIVLKYAAAQGIKVDEHKAGILVENVVWELKATGNKLMKEKYENIIKQQQAHIQTLTPASPQPTTGGK